MAVKIKSIQARRALESLGRNIRMARLKRRIPVKGLAERAGVSESTIIRLEKGDDGVSVGTVAMCCLALGEIARISDFLDPGSDNTGLLLDRETLPKRIAGKRKFDNHAQRDEVPVRPSFHEEDDGYDDGGVAF